MLLSEESIIESAEKNIIRNKGSTQVNRLIDDSLVIIFVSVHFGDYIGCSTTMYCSSESKLDIVVLWIGFVNHLTIGRSTVKNDLLPFNEMMVPAISWGRSPTDFPEEIFPLSKR